ncbi:DUF2231 domain-containing protein [Streptomyces sp. NPDC001083]|uniref:DUF2231 domain-containing protein n=1 Tax=Streptomyces sp. NPDC001083 TaxID=3364545 RepID=UPI00368E7B5E
MNTHLFAVPGKLARSSASKGGSATWLATVAYLERAKAVDPAIRTLQRAIRALPLGDVDDLLRGRPLGHPVHPMLVQVPIGCWLSATVLDAAPTGRSAPTVLTAVGLAGIAPAALAGWVDWADLPLEEARVGLAHALTNVVAVAFYSASLAARLRGRSGKGKAWSLGGLTAVAVSGALGGHVAYRRALHGSPAA